MSIPARLSTKLHQVLGHEGMNDLRNWLEEERSQRLADREALIGEMRAGFASANDRSHALETSLHAEIHKVDRHVSEVKADLMKWSFVFWVGAVAAIAMLAGVLR